MEAMLERPMGKRKTGKVGRPPSAEGARDQVIGIRCRAAYKAWAQELADFLRLDVADMYDQAAVELARARGFDKPAPKR
jgi:hypothetical protein